MFNVYIYQNQVNSKYYVGQTINFKVRKGRHRNAESCNSSIFHRAIKKYGWDNFKLISLMEVNSKEEMDELEMLMITDLDSMNLEKGYNLTKGGEGVLGFKHKEESNEKNRIAHLGRIAWNKGIPQSEEQKKKHSIKMRGKTSKNKGKTLPEEIKDKISKSLKGNIPWNKGLTKETDERVKQYGEMRMGQQHSDETKQKISETKRKNRDLKRK